MSFFEKIAYVWKNYNATLFSGVGNTILLALVGTVFGLIIGILIGVVRTLPKSKNKFVRFLMRVVNAIFMVYIEVFRGTPMMVQAMVIFYGYARITGVMLPVMTSGIVIVSINTGAYMAEIVRGGIISIDKGQFEGAHAIGMNHWQTMMNVIIPQVMRNILPSVSNEFVINIKDTSVLNVIYVTELFFMANIAASDTNMVLETYVIVSLMYLVMTFTVTRLLRLVERLLAGKKDYTICGSQSDPAAEIHVKEAH